MSTDLNVELLPWQTEVFQDKSRFKVIAAGRRTGKSRLAAWMLILYALQAKKGHVFYVAPTQGQARDIMWQTLLELAHPVVKSSHINNLHITLINGATISLKGEVWEQILRPALADQKGDAMFIGTPMGRNHFYELYKYAELSDDPTYKAWHFTSYDNPLLDPEEINVAKKSMSSFAFRQEFMASFEALGSEIFKEEWIEFDEPPQYGDYYIAIDMAGFEEMGKKTKNKRLDSTAIAVAKVDSEGCWHLEDMIHGRWTFEETANKIFGAVAKYDPISVGIEKGIARQAIMSPLTDLMKQRGKFFRVEELTHGNRKKLDRIVAALQGRFEHGRITLSKGDWNAEFLDQLFQFPDPLTHDDMIDAFAYIDQLAIVSYASDFDIDDEFEMVDPFAGY